MVVNVVVMGMYEKRCMARKDASNVERLVDAYLVWRKVDVVSAATASLSQLQVEAT